MTKARIKKRHNSAVKIKNALCFRVSVTNHSNKCCWVETSIFCQKSGKKISKKSLHFQAPPRKRFSSEIIVTVKGTVR